MNVTKPTSPKFIFTPSAGKTGTTALAQWLVDNQIWAEGEIDKGSKTKSELPYFDLFFLKI